MESKLNDLGDGNYSITLTLTLGECGPERDVVIMKMFTPDVEHANMVFDAFNLGARFNL